MYVCISNKIMEEIKLVPVVYNYPRAFPRAHTSTWLFFFYSSLPATVLHIE